MRKKMSGLRWLIRILLIPAVLVILARSGLMPVVMPESITDGIIDVTEFFFQSERNATFLSVVEDWADRITGLRKMKEAESRSSFLREQVNRWTGQMLHSARYIANHSSIRSALPDYGTVYNKLFAERYLQQKLKIYPEIRQIILYDSQKRVIAYAGTNRSGVSPVAGQFPESKIDNPGQVYILKDGTVRFITAFLSPGRRKRGTLVLDSSSDRLQEALKQATESAGYWMFLTDTDGRIIQTSGVSGTFNSELMKKLTSGQVQPENLAGQKFLKIGDRSRRLLQSKWSPEHARFVLHLLVILPEPDLMLPLRLAGIVVLGLVIFTAIYLTAGRVMRRIAEYQHGVRITRELKQLALTKAVSAGKQLSEAADEAGSLFQEQAALLGTVLDKAESTRVKVIQRPRSVPVKPVQQKQSLLDDLLWVEQR